MNWKENKRQAAGLKGGNWTAKCLILIFVLVLSTLVSGCGTPNLEKNLDQVTKETAEYVLEATPNVLPGSIGGEWALLGVKKSGIEVSKSYEEDYLKQAANVVARNKGVLSEDKYTEYARFSIGLIACGQNPSEFSGYNLISPLDDYQAVADQGINAMDFALIASKMAGVNLNNQQRYIDDVVKSINDGTFDNDEYATDYLAMNIQALSLYDDDKAVKDAIEKACKQLSELQKDDGSMGNCDSTCEVIIALSQIGKNIFEDKDFIKDGKSLGDGLMKFRLKDNSFAHTEKEKAVNGMSTEKALLALDSLKLMKDGKRLFE